MNKLGPSVKKHNRLLFGVASLGALSVVAAACGGGSTVNSSAAGATTTTTTTTTAPASPTTTNKGTTNPGGRSGSGFAPAASGTIASINGKTLEVQNSQSGQTTVDMTSKTAVSGTLASTLREVKVGTCVSTTGTKVATADIKATSVVISSAVKGACGFGGAGAGGRGFAGRPGGFPGAGGGRTGAPPGRTGGRLPANFTITAGKVTSVAGTKLTIAAVVFSGVTRSTTTTAPGNGSGSRTPKTSPVTVTVSASTKYTRQEKMSVAGLKVGECATAFGSTNQIGAVTATRLTVTQATSTGCSATGFGGFGGRGPGGGGFGGGGFGGNGAGAPS